MLTTDATLTSKQLGYIGDNACPNSRSCDWPELHWI